MYGVPQMILWRNLFLCAKRRQGIYKNHQLQLLTTSKETLPPPQKRTLQVFREPVYWSQLATKEWHFGARSIDCRGFWGIFTKLWLSHSEQRAAAPREVIRLTEGDIPKQYMGEVQAGNPTIMWYLYTQICGHMDLRYCMCSPGKPEICINRW